MIWSVLAGAATPGHYDGCSPSSVWGVTPVAATCLRADGGDMFLTAAPAPPSPPEPSPPDGRRAGATWVAATGAFLLVAAAAVFIAVRWDSLPAAAKLALVGALTGGFLAGGRAVRRTLPATGDVLFHLGAFLLPIDVAGLCVRAQVGWRNLLLSEGVLGVAALGSLSVASGSVVLAWAAGASMLVLALGIAAVSPLPAPLLLALAATAAHLLGRRRAAVSWAAVAGLAPVLATGVGNALATLSGRDLGAGTLAEIGLAGSSAALWAAASGLLSAAVLGREAHQRKDLALVALAATSLLCGAGTAWAAADPSDDVTYLTGPAVFVVLQLLAIVAARDVFWRRPARAVAVVSEVLAALAAPIALFWVAIAPLVEDGIDFFGDDAGMEPAPVGATALALLAAGWLLAGWRRQSPKPTVLDAVRAAVADDRTVGFAFLAAIGAVVLGTASSLAIAAALVVSAAALLLSGGILATILAVGAAGWAAVVVGPSHPALVLPVGIVAAATIVVAGAARHRGAPAVALAAAASVLTISSASFAVDEIGMTAALLVGVFAAWAMAFHLDRTSTPTAAIALRCTWLLATAVVHDGRPSDALPVAIAATLLLLVDAVRLDDPRIAYGAAISGPVAVFAATAMADLAVAESGVVLAGAAVVLTGLAALAPERWRAPVIAAAATSLGAALPLSIDEPARFAEVVVLAGGLVIALGLTLRQALLAHAGGALATIGIAIHLTVDGVTATEPYVVPVALQLLVLGEQLRRRVDDRPSSWIAFGPSIALLGGAAFAERLDGGAAWHALVAGAVGVLAVAAGGWKRLAAPLFLGTGLLVAVTVLETLHTLAGVPTWAWLAAGGSALLVAGIAMERSATSPSEAGRRLVDVVGERFE